VISAFRRYLAPVYALTLVLVIVAPLLAPGYLLLRDAVSTPKSYLSDDALGLSESAPRAVPQDFLVALASHLIDGGVVVKVILTLGLWLAGWGAARLAALIVPESGIGGELVATTVAVWNPYVAERLLQGHWSLLVGYGCLPWVAAAMLRVRRGDDEASPSWWPLLFWTALAGLTPTGLMLAATVAVACALVPGGTRPRWLCTATGLGISLLVALPWLIASAVTDSLSSAESGIAAFAARAEPGLGTVGSLAAMGGIWNANSVPGLRTGVFAVIGALVLVGVVALGLPAVWRRPAAAVLLLVAAVAVLIPTAMATGIGTATVEALVRSLPGLGVVRDGQKWVALVMPGYAVAAAGAVLTLRRWLPTSAAAAACCVALLAVLPDLAWGVGGSMRAVHYPPGWATVAATINADPRPVAVLPADTIRRFAWSGPAPVLDPLPRWLRPHVYSTGDLTISGQTVLGEGSNARDIQRMLLGGADRRSLARAGVGWIVVESGTPGETGSASNVLKTLPVVYHDSDISVYRVGGDSPGASAVERAVMIAAHAVWLGALAIGGIGAVVMAVRRRRRAASDQAAHETPGTH
jgi:hypothetical protein